MTIIDGKHHINQVRNLIIEYTQMLNRDLSFQNIDDELKDPSKKYTAPAGELLVAIENDEVVGMIAYHKHSATRCEMKRLYVKPKYRGMKLGEQLIQKLIELAIQSGYTEMVLDTLLPLQSAIYLYQKLGFQQCEPYYNNPMNDVIYFKKMLLE
ncbi:MAG: GNAT family N-acetyltransferase [Firmicutes bacterium]|jgi:ribosomal protein S18 acetylase RimI-like enzyme|nr:GNAT family N-acetyltransferase [Bacillota bacterium]